MAYYLRLFSPNSSCVPWQGLQAAIAAIAPGASLTLDAGVEEGWEQLTLVHPDGDELAVVERNPVAAGLLAAEELDEFRDEVDACSPASAAEWLRSYFDRVRTIYAFQVLASIDSEGGWDLLDGLKHAIQECVGGIFQADGEGFENEEGCHILWQFSDDAAGPCSMGVLRNGRWVCFEMDLGDHQHRQAFFRGEVPPGVRPR